MNKQNVLKDRTGQRFGRLIVLERAENKRLYRDGSSRVQWLCKCYCGNETIVPSRCLHQGTVKSCGCLTYTSNAKLTEEDIPRILEMLARGESYRHIASFFPVKYLAIWRIDKGKTWKHISRLWHNGQHQQSEALRET